MTGASRKRPHTWGCASGPTNAHPADADALLLLVAHRQTAAVEFDLERAEKPGEQVGLQVADVGRIGGVAQVAAELRRIRLDTGGLSVRLLAHDQALTAQPFEEEPWHDYFAGAARENC